MIWREYIRIQFEVLCPDQTLLLQKLVNKHISVYNVQYINQFVLRFYVTKGQESSARAIIKKQGYTYSVIHEAKIAKLIYKIKRNPVLLGIIIVIFVLTLVIPTRIWFVRVEGNRAIPSDYILAQAQNCGLYFGASRRSVRSEKVKNTLIEIIPNLQWVGINTEGCVATIYVEEKSVFEETEDNVQGQHIFARMDGVVLSSVIEQGSAQCQIGQAVKKGQLLVSGYIDSGLHIKLTNAKAEIYAITDRELTLVTPSQCYQRIDAGRLIKRYSLLIGKKLINLYNDSGIYPGTCVKMYKEDFISLPGGFQLPVAVITESVVIHEAVCILEDDQELCWLKDYANEYILHQMVGGEIVSSNPTFRVGQESCEFYGKFTCIEMIGINKTEEKLYYYGKNSRENRKCRTS